MAYETIPPSVGASAIAIVGGDGLSGDGSAIDPLALVPASALTPGSLSIVDFNKLATLPVGASMMVAFISDEIDFATAATTPFGGNWPSLPGKVFAPNTLRVFMTNIAATTFLTNGSIQMGNNVAVDNICPAAAQPNAATLNTELAAGAGGTYNHGAFNGSGVVKLPDLTTTPSVKVNTAVTGTSITQCKGRVVAYGVVTALMVPT